MVPDGLHYLSFTLCSEQPPDHAPILPCGPEGPTKWRTQMPVSPIPAGYHSVTPYLIVNGAARALPWYVQAFGARELMRLSGPGGKIGHAEIEIGDSHIMLADESLEQDAKSPASFGGS